MKRRDYLPWICTLQERIRLLKAAGVDVVVPITFTRDIANLPAREFVMLLRNNLNMCGLVLGPDFALGKQRLGTPENLRKIGEELGFRAQSGNCWRKVRSIRWKKCWAGIFTWKARWL